MCSPGTGLAKLHRRSAITAMGNRKRKGATPLHGQYANFFKVGHNAAEFVIDLGQFYPDNGTARLHTRIITGPTYAKALLELLANSVEGYEQIHGTIAKEHEVH